MIDIGTEWEISGLPSLSLNSPATNFGADNRPPYRHICNKGTDAEREQQAREFVARILSRDPSGWGGTLRLRSRQVQAMPWRDEPLTVDGGDDESH